MCLIFRDLKRRIKCVISYRHNKVAVSVNWKIFKKHRLESTESCYDHRGKTVTQNNDVTILWGMPI